MKYVSVLLNAAVLSASVSANAFEPMEVNVNKDMLLWEKGYEYMTNLRFRVKLDGVHLVAHTAKMGDDRSVEGSSNPNYYFASYFGKMEYSTKLLDGGTDNQGSAARHYSECEIKDQLSEEEKTEPIEMEIETKGFWDSTKLTLGSFMENWIGGGRYKFHPLMSREVEGRTFHSMEVLNPKEIRDRVNCSLEIFNQLSGKTYELRWDSPIGSTCNIKVTNMCDPQTEVGNDVRKAIEAESTMLYGALTKGLKRKPGDVWKLEAENLRALVSHPALNVRLDGYVFVKAEKLDGEIGSLDGVTTEKTYGLKLKFINGYKGEYSNFVFEVKTTDGSTVEIPMDLNRNSGEDRGELWLDSVRRIVPYGLIKVSNSEYNAHMPKIGDFARDAHCDGRIGIFIWYLQTRRGVSLGKE